MTEVQANPRGLFRERIDSGYFEEEVVHGTKPTPISVSKELPATSGLPPNTPTGPKLERLGDELRSGIHGNSRGREHGKHTYQPYHIESAQRPLVSDTPGPPFTFGNRLGFIHGEPVEGPMTELSHAMSLFEEAVKAQEEKRRETIRNVGNGLKVQIFTHRKLGKAAELISLSSTTVGTVSAVEVANAQAAKLDKQKDEIAALREALDQAWSDIDTLRIEIWRRTSICDICGRECSEVGTNQSEVTSQKPPVNPHCDDEPLLLLD